MIWKSIPGFSNYSISNTGLVKNNQTNRLKKTTVDNYGYLMFGITKNYKQKAFRIHRLLAQLFIENPKNQSVINHKDGNKLNNSLNNLEWCTYKHNNIHAFNTGLNMHIGENNTASKITEKDALEIIKELNFGLRIIDVSKKLNISYNIVKNIKNGKNWKRVVNAATERKKKVEDAF